MAAKIMAAYPRKLENGVAKIISAGINGGGGIINIKIG